MRNFKPKKLLTVMLLLFLWQRATCGIIFLTNGMDYYRLKFAVMPANDNIHEKKSIFLGPKESCILIVDVSKRERLWVAYDTICKLPDKWHYRSIDLSPDDKNCCVTVRNIRNPILGGAATYDVTPFPISCTMEPKWFSRVAPHFDTTSPAYLATFTSSGVYSGSCNSGISLGSSLAPHVPLQYSVEFGPDRIDCLPDDIQNAIAGKYDGIDRSRGLFEGLVNCGVERILITACGFGPLQDSQLNVDLSEFIKLDSQHNPNFNSTVHIGIFENKGIKTDCSVKENALTHASFPPISYKRCSFTCVAAPDYGSCYVVAITSDQKSILITHVLVAISETEVREIRRTISSAFNFQEIPVSFKMSAGTDESNLALRDTGNVLETMSGGCERKGVFTYYCPDYFPVKEGLTYTLTGEFKSAGIIESLVHFCVACYDKNKSLVPIIRCTDYKQETETKLTEDCNDGDKIILVKKTNGWPPSESKRFKCIAFYNDDESALKRSFIVERVVDKSNNEWEVHLLNGIDKSYQKDTKVRCTSVEEGKTYLGASIKVPCDCWTHHEYNLSPTLKSIPSIKYICIKVLGNCPQDGKETTLQYRNIELKSCEAK